MEKETMGTVISVTKQWWLKVNRKPVRAHAMDGAAFPHTIKVKYTIDGKDYISSLPRLYFYPTAKYCSFYNHAFLRRLHPVVASAE